MFLVSEIQNQEIIYKANFVLTLNNKQPFLTEGAVVVKNQKILKVGSFKEVILLYPNFYVEEINGLLMPGLMNSHCHLELSSLVGKIGPTKNFLNWIKQLQKVTENYTQNDWVKSVEKGVIDSIVSGTTQIVDVGNSGTSYQSGSQNLQGLYYREIIGLNVKRGLDYWNLQQQNLQEDFLFYQNRKSRTSASAHAPFSCSPELLKSIIDYNQTKSTPFIMHLAESIEEEEFFEKHMGSLFDFCKNIEPNLFVKKYSKQSSIQYLIQIGALPKNSVMVHCNTITESEVAYFFKNKISIIHCPQSHSFFDHPPFPYDLCRQYGVSVVLGTDSLASNTNLNLFQEMNLFKKTNLQVPCQDIIKMVTRTSSKIWKNSFYSGRIKEGDMCNMIILNLPSKNYSLDEIFNSVVYGDCEWNSSIVQNQQFLKSL